VTDATTARDRPVRPWLALAEILFTYAVLLALLVFVIWEAVTQLGAQDRTLPLATAVLVLGTLVYSLVTRLRGALAQPAAQPTQPVPHVSTAAATASQDTMSDTYGAIASDPLTARHAYAIVAFCMYVLITPRLNFYVATGLFVMVLSLALRVRWLAAAIGLALALAIPALFQFGLEMRLP
jgi:hypothetical protein